MADNDEEIGAALRARSMAEFAERTKGKPTPTQAEIDAAAMGQGTLEHEHDGSNLDETASPLTMDHHPTRTMEAVKPSEGYQTRQTTARARVVRVPEPSSD